METPDSLANPFSNARIVGVDVDPISYHKLQGERGKPEFIVSNSMLKEFARCPRKWRVGGEPERDSDACRWGELLDARVLSPKQFGNRFAVVPAQYQDSKTGDMEPWTFAANVCKQWREDHSGTIHVKTEEMDGADDAIGRLQSDDGIAVLLAISKTQVHVAADYRDKATGLIIPVKGLIDLVPNKDELFFGRCLADLKTTRHGGMRQWVRECYNFGYHIQAAMYLDLYTAATGEDRTEFLHVLSENTPPYEPGKRLMTARFIEIGRRFYQSTLSFYCECLARDTWPSYDYGREGVNGWSFCAPEDWMEMADDIQTLPPVETETEEETQTEDLIP